MLKLRKILLYNYPYYLIFIIVIIVSLIRLNITKTSEYDTNTKQVIGIITTIKEKDNLVTLTVKNKEKILVTYYLNKINKKYKLGDKVKVIGEFKEPK